MNFVEREKEIEKFWRDNDIFKKSMENRKEGETYTADCKWKTAYRSCINACYQRYDPKIPDHERQDGSAKSRLGYAWTSGRVRGRKTLRSGWKRADRRIRIRPIYQEV